MTLAENIIRRLQAEFHLDGLQGTRGEKAVEYVQQEIDLEQSDPLPTEPEVVAEPTPPAPARKAKSKGEKKSVKPKTAPSPAQFTEDDIHDDQ